MADPSTYTGALIWLSPDASNLWTGSVGGTNVANVDDTIQNAETDISSIVLTQATAGNRPQWKGSGWIYCGLSTANRWFTHDSSEAYYNDFHVNGNGGILVSFQRSTADASTNEVMVTNHNLSTGRQGFLLNVNSADNLVFTLDVNGATIGTLTLGSVADTNTHICEVRLVDGLLWGRIDNRAPVTATLSGALGTGNASSIVRIGVRSGNTLPANQNLRDLVILNSAATNANRLDWRTRNPYAQDNATLDVAEIRVGSKMEINLRDLYEWTADSMRYDGYALIPGLSGVYGGTVLSIASEWHGSGHGNETITSKTISIDGVSETLNAGLYVSASSATITRESTLGTTFNLRSTKVLKETGFTETVRLERIDPSDGKSISSSAYPWICSLAPAMNNYIWYDEDGATLDSGTFSGETLNAEITAPSGAIALLSYDTTNDKGLLHVLKNPGTLTPDLFAVRRSTDNKFYGRMVGLDGSEGGEVFTTVWTVEVIEATGATYEAAGSAAVARALNPPKSTGGMGIKLGLGL